MIRDPVHLDSRNIPNRTIMKRWISLAFMALLPLCVCAITLSCSDLTLNEVEGSYFLLEESHVQLEDKGYLQNGFEGEIALGCYGNRGEDENVKDCITVLIPADGYALNNNRLTFRNSFKAKVRFCTTFYESNGHAVTGVHLQQETRVHVSGTLSNNTASDFFQPRNVYSGPVSVSFTLDDGSKVRLKMNTVTVQETGSLIAGWL